MKSVDFPSPNGTVLQLNHAIKLKEPGKNLINGLIMELHFLDKAAFAFGIITYRKAGWPKEYRLRTNVR